jgi:hypothetical protein
MNEIRVIMLAVKAEGLRATLKRWWWRAVAVVVTFYLVRDILLYILLPWMLLK